MAPSHERNKMMSTKKAERFLLNFKGTYYFFRGIYYFM